LTNRVGIRQELRRYFEVVPLVYLALMSEEGYGLAECLLDVEELGESEHLIDFVYLGLHLQKDEITSPRLECF
jgi:hypothetical protein